MKKILLVILIIAACLTFAACDMLPGSGNGSGGSGNGTGGDGQEHTHVAASETVVTKEPTCSEVGSANVVCAECGEVMSTVSVPATGAHVSEVIPAEAPTCTSGGFPGRMRPPRRWDTCRRSRCRSEPSHSDDRN